MSDTQTAAEPKTEGFKVGGLYQKYKIERNDGTPIQEGSEFFVLRVDSDPHARSAMALYASLVARENLALGEEIFQGLIRVLRGEKFYQEAA